MKYVLIAAIAFMFSGCIVGTVVSLPFKAVGAIIPGPVGTGVSATGSIVNTAIPF